MVCLIKPQFEAGRDKVGKKGVVSDKNVHIKVIYNVINFARENNFRILDLSFSPIKGPEGNIEYLLYLTKDIMVSDNMKIEIEEVVQQAHGDL